MYCYSDDCFVPRPLVGELIGAFFGLILWGESPNDGIDLVLTVDVIGIYACLFAVTAFMLRRQGGKYTRAFSGIVVLFVLNIVQTGRLQPAALLPAHLIAIPSSLSSNRRQRMDDFDHERQRRG